VISAGATSKPRVEHLAIASGTACGCAGPDVVIAIARALALEMVAWDHLAYPVVL
jgi:hypothetical protein